MDTVVIGCGYVGLRVATQLVKKGHRVYGIRRSIIDHAPFEAAGITPLAIDITKPSELKRIPTSIQWAINAVSSSRRGAAVYRQVYFEATRSLVKHLAKNGIQRYLHVSSTSVYGQTDGSWVDETAPRLPATEAGRTLVETEDLLLNAWRGRQFPALVTRASGIYGPGRGYLFHKYLKNEAAMIGDGSRIMNMIHVDDLATAIICTLENGSPGQAYNLTDCRPVTQFDFFSWLAAKLGKPLPPSASESELRQRKRAVTNKRVSNQRLRNELHFKFQYPSYREGYARAAS
ncbi:MAG: 3 beta-hydroxysteroid dehydrogenase/Delta 5--_4-isomerase [Verrucomicrobia subdivision 3 bacterium]|nr:3 beta-hydroxysteroid dehydrogenase/Delta 5-->4-isomerase [Limisphaerales bacterium]MCS1414904.1 3 beta-hydroxysteroid dehydrogenase/Delta 5-->4-isomerase [Limisphaerales bacterium]